MTPEELKAAIARNPPSSTERGELIQTAVNMGMADEIPADWGITVDGEPVEEQYETIYSLVFYTETDPLALSVHEDGSPFIETMDGDRLLLFGIMPEFEQEVQTLKFDISWANAFAGDPRPGGDRPPDPTNGLNGWVNIEQVGPSQSQKITVGYVQDLSSDPDAFRNGKVVLIFNDRQRYSLDHKLAQKLYRETLPQFIKDYKELIND